MVVNQSFILHHMIKAAIILPIVIRRNPIGLKNPNMERKTAESIGVPIAEDKSIL